MVPHIPIAKNRGQEFDIPSPPLPLESLFLPVPHDGSESWEYQGMASRNPHPDALAFNFYVSSKDLDKKASPGGSLRLHLCQVNAYPVAVHLPTLRNEI